MTESQDKGERIAKVLARAGVGSRRDVEAMIAQGRITQGGAPVTTPATFIHDVTGIALDGKLIEDAGAVVLYRYHKPPGVITTHKDPQGRPTVFDQLPRSAGRLISVGRLDLNSEGLLLLTNSGALAHALENPKAGIKRLYRVRAHGKISQTKLDSLADGVTVEGVRYGPIEATLERGSGANSWMTVSLEEGKNREIRKVLAHLGLTVNRLIRTHFGSFSLGSLPRRGVAIVAPAQVSRALKEMGVEGFDAPEPSERKGWAKAKPKKRKPPAGRRKARAPGKRPERPKKPT